jgi:hypothetical protein
VPTIAGWTSPIASVYDPISNCIRIHYIADANRFAPGLELHLHELLLGARGGWQDADLTAIWAGNTYPSYGGGVALIYDPLHQKTRSHFINADGHMHELWLDGQGWHDEDLTAQGGGPGIQDGSTIALIYDPVNHVLRNHHVGWDEHVHELYLDASGWHDADLTVAGGGPPLFNNNRIATIFDPLDNVVRINYADSAFRVHELYLDGSGWHDEDLTAIGAGPNAFTDTHITFAFIPGSIQANGLSGLPVTESCYIAVDQHVHALALVPHR